MHTASLSLFQYLLSLRKSTISSLMPTKLESYMRISSLSTHPHKFVICRVGRIYVLNQFVSSRDNNFCLHEMRDTS